MRTTLRCPDSPDTPPQLHIVPLVQLSDAPPAIKLDDPQLHAAAQTLLAQPEASADHGCLTLSGPDSPRLLAVGLGTADELDVQRIQSAAGALLELLQRMRVTCVQLETNRALADELEPADLAHDLAEGLALAGYAFDDYRHDAPEQHTLTLAMPDAESRTQAQLAITRAQATNFARHLAALPPNVGTPYFLAEQAQKLADDANLQCTIYRGLELEERDMVGLINVGKASEHKPCLIELVYEPASATSTATPTLALVGKTITFDSGGLSLKINDTMRYMKYDKAAGAAVLGTMQGIAALKPDCRVVALLPAAENAISELAYRVDDIITFPNGVSVEITNTDYEGRLVMADALIHACKHHQPDALIDLGTLTGEIITALGHETAGLWCDDDELYERLLDAAEATGEPVWPMPLDDEHRRAIRAHHADIVNLNLEAPAKPSQCAAFLNRFIDPPEMPWAHLDIAGTVHTTTARPPFAVGPTGFGTRLLLDLITNW